MASGPARRHNGPGRRVPLTVTLENLHRTGGAAVVRSWRTLADFAVSGEPLKRFAMNLEPTKLPNALLIPETESCALGLSGNQSRAFPTGGQNREFT